MILRKCLHFQIGRDMVLAAVTWKTYVKVVFVMFLIYLIALAATRDIAIVLNITNAGSKKNTERKSTTEICIGILDYRICIYVHGVYCSTVN